MHGVGAGHAVVGSLVAGYEFLALGIVHVGRPVGAAEHADRGVLLRGQGRFVDRECRQHRDLVGKTGLPVLLDEADAHAARHEGEQRIGLGGRNLCNLDLEVQRAERCIAFL